MYYTKIDTVLISCAINSNLSIDYYYEKVVFRKCKDCEKPIGLDKVRQPASQIASYLN